MNFKVNLYRGFIIILLMLIFVSAFFMSFFYNFSDNKYIRKINATVEKEVHYKISNKDGTTGFNTLDNLNTISVLYNYSIKLDDLSSIEDNYKIVGRLVISNDDKDLFIEELDDESSLSLKENGYVLNIKETKDLAFIEDFIEYQNALKEYGYENVHSRIDYILENDINLYNNYLNKSIKKNDDVILSIDLDKGVIISDNKKYDQVLYGKVDVDTCYAICMELITSIVLFALIIILLLRRINLIKSSFVYRLNRILKKYDKYIVDVKSFPVLDNKVLEDAVTFKELVNISKSLSIPINYLNIKNKHEATFMVITNTTGYVYKLK